MITYGFQPLCAKEFMGLALVKIAHVNLGFSWHSCLRSAQAVYQVLEADSACIPFPNWQGV